MKSLFQANKIFLKEVLASGKTFVFFQLLALLLVFPFNYLITYAPKKFLDSITEDRNLQLALFWIVIWLSIRFFDLFYRNTLDILKKRVFFKSKIASKDYTYKKIELIHLTYFENPKNLNEFNKALSYNESGGETLVNLFITVISSLFSIVTMTYISIQFEWWLWTVIIGLVFVQFFTDRYMKKLSFNFGMAKVEKDRKQNYYNGLPTNKNSIAEIKVNSNMAFFFNKYKKSFEENREFQEKHEKKMQKLSFLFSLPNEIFTFFCYWLIGYRMLNGSSTVGDYTLFFTMVNIINSNLKTVISSTNMFYEQSLLANVYLDFIDNTDNFASSNIDNAETVLPRFESLEFKNVTFYYPDQTIPTLKNLTLTINRGEKIALIGYNGAGKTTFIKLLSFLFKPSEGEIFYNGINLSSLDGKKYWENLGIVFQNHQEFSMSIKDNILLRENEADEKIVWDALNMVGLDKKIRENPYQLHLQLGKLFDKEGMDLSGGERQKLALARVLAKKCDFYVFDEPTSALDPQSEDQLYSCMASLPKDQTVIMISHRLTSLFIVDRIIFFKDGEILADGSHETLMNTCLEYKNLYEMQLKKFK